MRLTGTFVASLALVAMGQAGAAEQWKTPVPESCPVTRSAPETRFTVTASGSQAQRSVAMLLMLELPERGCWQVTGNYKNDSLSWVTWVD